MRGRKPKPTRIKVLSGNPGKRPLAKDDVKPPRALPRPPAILQNLARKEWWRIGRVLYEAGLLTQIDVPALVAYCQSYATWCEAQQEIRRSGTVIKSGRGQPMLSPFLKVANIAWQQWTHILTEFGMTPSSRSRVTIANPAAEEDEFEKFLNRGGIRMNSGRVRVPSGK
jgi:P27 family predicted phage terminase small subunit